MSDDAQSAAGGQHIPALNEIMRQRGEEPVYPDHPEERKYLILYPEDYQEHGIDMAGNVALLVNEEQARKVKRLAEGALKELTNDE